MAKHYLGQLSAFQQDSDTISAYLERVQIFFNANGIEEDKQKVAIFLNAIGARTYTLLSASSKACRQDFCRITESFN